MPILTLFTFAVDLAFAFHVIRSGRELYWIYIIVFIPGIGPALYFFTQVLPDMKNSRTLKRAGHRLVKAIDPRREFRARKDALVISDTLENRVNLADECLEANLVDEAISLYESCLKGPHEFDPKVLLCLANAHFAAENPSDSKRILDQLIETNPEFKSVDAHLLYARALEGMNLFDQAVQEYEILSTGFPGEEARARFGLLHLKMGQQTRAQRLFEEILVRTKRAPKYYQKKEKPWINIAKAQSR